jgi:Gpi18-like mannosyltransferase
LHLLLPLGMDLLPTQPKLSMYEIIHFFSFLINPFLFNLQTKSLAIPYPKKTSRTYIIFQWVHAKNWHHGLEQGVIMNHINLVCTKVIYWNCLNMKNVYLSTLTKDPCYHPLTIALHILLVALYTLIINH